MSIRTKTDLEQFQDNYLNGNFTVAPEIFTKIQSKIIAGSSVKLAQAPTAAFFRRDEMVDFISQLDTEFVKVFLVKTGGGQLTMAVAGADDDFVNSGEDRPTNTVFLKDDPSDEGKGLLAFRPCPPYCQEDKKIATHFFILRLSAPVDPV